MESQPHPDLAAIFSEIYEGENSADREKGSSRSLK